MSQVKNELATMYGGGFARLIDANENLYRLVNILEATVNFDSKQDFLRAIYPNSPSQVIAVATVESTVTIMAKMGEFTKEMMALSSNLQFNLLKEATFPVIAENHVMLTTRTSLRYPHAGESTIKVFVREGGYEKELQRIIGSSYSAKVTRKVTNNDTGIYVDDLSGFPQGRFDAKLGAQTFTIVGVDAASSKLLLKDPWVGGTVLPGFTGEIVQNNMTGAVTRLAEDTTKDSVSIVVEDVTNFPVGSEIKIAADANVFVVWKVEKTTSQQILHLTSIKDYAPWVASRVPVVKADGFSTYLVADVVGAAAGASTFVEVADASDFSVDDLIKIAGGPNLKITAINDNKLTVKDNADEAIAAVLAVNAIGLRVNKVYLGQEDDKSIEYATATRVPGVYEYDVQGNDIIVHAKWKGYGISVDYERRVGAEGGNADVAFKIGGDGATEIGYLDFHLILQSQQGKWMYYRFPAAIPSGKFQLDLRGSFMNVPQEFTAVTPPGWAKPFLIQGEL